MRVSKTGVVVNGLKVRGVTRAHNMVQRGGTLRIAGVEYMPFQGEWVSRDEIEREQNEIEQQTKRARISKDESNDEAKSAQEFRFLELEGDAEEAGDGESHCAQCLVNRPNVIFKPCKHFRYCVECVRQWDGVRDSCATCNVKIESADVALLEQKE